MAARKAEFSVVGRNQPRLDGPEKLTGRAVFTDDVVLPGMLHGKIVRSPLPRARILNIDTSAALRLPGVKAVITHADAPRVYVGIEQPLFRKDSVNYVGDEIAAVAALDEATATEAARLIRVDYEPLPAVLTMKDALNPDAVQIHPKAKGNIAWAQNRDLGEVDSAFAASAHIRSDQYSTAASHNCYAEFHVVVADWSHPDKLSVWTPTQTALLFQKAIARAVGLTDGAVRVMSLHTGGGSRGVPPRGPTISSRPCCRGGPAGRSRSACTATRNSSSAGRVGRSSTGSARAFPRTV